MLSEATNAHRLSLEHAQGESSQPQISKGEKGVHSSGAGLPTGRSMQAWPQACIICCYRPFPVRNWAGPLSSSPWSPKMLLNELVHDDSHSGCFGGRSWGGNNFVLDKTVSVCWKRKKTTSTNGRGYCLRQFQTPRRPLCFPAGLNWWVLFQTAHTGIVFIFISSSESSHPPFSHWKITLFHLPAYHKIRAWLPSIAFIPNCS